MTSPTLHSLFPFSRLIVLMIRYPAKSLAVVLASLCQSVDTEEIVTRSPNRTRRRGFALASR